MFALSFKFLTGRYHGTPWGRNVNEADVEWPPEPWRLLRALIATYWRKSNHSKWTGDHLSSLIESLARSLPEYSLPSGAIHAHTRHYMPTSGISRGSQRTTLIFDSFMHFPQNTSLIVAWPCVTLEEEVFEFAADLARALGYLGRSESWTECTALNQCEATMNYRPASSNLEQGKVERLLAPLMPEEYSKERRKIIDEIELRLVRQMPNVKVTETRIAKKVTSKVSKANILPEKLVDALSLDSADLQDCHWTRPPAAREVPYVFNASELSASSICGGSAITTSLGSKQVNTTSFHRTLPTVARFLLAGRPLPRIEDAVKISELMRRAALSKFGWKEDDFGKQRPMAPWQISGRPDGKPNRDPHHGHAFWMPEDSDGDGFIDHLSVYISVGMDSEIRRALDRITRLWLDKPIDTKENSESLGTKEWRLALDGFGLAEDFGQSSSIFANAKCWQSVTPFLSSGRLKRAGYSGEVLRLLKLRGHSTINVSVNELDEITVGGTVRRPIHFYRFRSRGREEQLDTSGTFLRIEFPDPKRGPLALGYASHFGLGLFSAI